MRTQHSLLGLAIPNQYTFKSNFKFQHMFVKYLIEIEIFMLKNKIFQISIEFFFHKKNFFEIFLYYFLQMINAHG